MFLLWNQESIINCNITHPDRIHQYIALVVQTFFRSYQHQPKGVLHDDRVLSSFAISVSPNCIEIEEERETSESGFITTRGPSELFRPIFVAAIMVYIRCKFQ
jgi:hypothetical protein